MKTRIRITGIATILMFVASNLSSQSMGSEYRTALGVKFFPGAISLKHFKSEKIALEGLGYFYNDGFRLTGLYEIHGNFAGATGLKWYIGPGAHIGFWNDSWRDNNPNHDGPDNINIGVDGVLGLDYKFTGAPINVSLDWQPSINLVGYNGFQSGWGGLAVRYTF